MVRELPHDPMMTMMVIITSETTRCPHSSIILRFPRGRWSLKGWLARTTWLISLLMISRFYASRTALFTRLKPSRCPLSQLQSRNHPVSARLCCPVLCHPQVSPQLNYKVKTRISQTLYRIRSDIFHRNLALLGSSFLTKWANVIAHGRLRISVIIARPQNTKKGSFIAFRVLFTAPASS